MKSLLKYELPGLMSSVYLNLPKGAQVLSVANQRNNLVMWALVDQEQPVEARQFYICYTGPGNEPPSGSRFIGTVLFEDGHYVVHVFEVENSAAKVSEEDQKMKEHYLRLARDMVLMEDEGCQKKYKSKI